MVKKTGFATTMMSGKTSNRKIRQLPMKNLSRVLEIQKNNQIKNSFTGVPKMDMRTCFNRQFGASDKHAAAAPWIVTFEIGR